MSRAYRECARPECGRAVGKNRKGAYCSDRCETITEQLELSLDKEVEEYDDVDPAFRFANA